MAKWAHTVDFTTEFNQARAGDVGVKELITLVLAKLRPLSEKISGNVAHVDLRYSLDEIIDNFSCMSESSSVDFDDFDEVLSELYDWGDVSLSNGSKNCWIATS